MRHHNRICNEVRVHVLLVLQQLKKSPSSCVSCTCILMISFLSDDDRDYAWLVVFCWFISSLCQPTQTPTHNFVHAYCEFTLETLTCQIENSSHIFYTYNTVSPYNVPVTVFLWQKRFHNDNRDQYKSFSFLSPIFAVCEILEKPKSPFLK